MKIRIIYRMAICYWVAFVSFPAIGQELSGRVVEKSTGMPLPGVSVFIPELNKGVVTDIHGDFAISSLPERDLTFQLSFIGFKTIITEIDPSPVKQPMDIQMEETTGSLDEVVISGAYLMSRENSPIVIEKVSREQVLKMPSPSLMSTLSKLPGVNQVSLGPGISKPVIRGLSFSRVLSVYQ